MNNQVKNLALRTFAAVQAFKNNGGTSGTFKNQKSVYAPKTVRKAISQTRRDIADLQRARMMALAATNPKQYLLQDIYTIISDDAHLTSQLNNRKEQTISAAFEMLTPDKKRDEKITDLLNNLPIMQDLISYILDSEYFGNSLVELSVEDNTPKVELITRRNVVPDFGRFYPDTFIDNYIEYRKANEYKRWLLEFNSEHLGIFNKAVPHVLFKKFAQSCWSELCEIYGIPPRVMKTDTRNPQMLDRAEEMMRDIGAAAWFIIDTEEEFDFAKGVSTNGDVYSNLIALCNNEMSMLFSGAVLGQDTKNGNESKEKVSMEISDRLVDSDKRMVENYMNSIVIPAFIRIGWLPITTSKFHFTTAENTDKLFDMTVKIMPYKNVDDRWFKEKFGIEVTGDKGISQGGENLNFQ